MRKTILLLLLLVGAGFFSSVYGQGACTNNQVLACAGGFTSYQSVSPPLRQDMAACPNFQGQYYSADFGGGYNDFTSDPTTGTLMWKSISVPIQTLTATDSCFLYCYSSIPVPSLNCPSLTPSVAGARIKWITQSGPDGGIMGGQPDFQSGIMRPAYDCNTFPFSTGVPGVPTVTITRCFPGDVSDNIGSYVGAPSPDHCAFALQPASPRPLCACGYTASCNSNGQPGQGVWSCPAEYTTKQYFATDTCGNEYLVTDYYDCGIFQSETKQPVSTDQCVPPGTPA